MSDEGVGELSSVDEEAALMMDDRWDHKTAWWRGAMGHRLQIAVRRSLSFQQLFCPVLRMFGVRSSLFGVRGDVGVSWKPKLP